MPKAPTTVGKTIFISHSSTDQPIVQYFIDLILNGSLSVGIDEIFASSTDGMRIKSGDDGRDSIKGNLDTAKITFLIITPNYKESEVSLNEMGAAWVLSGKTVPLIVEPINYKTVGVIQQPNQIEKLLDEGGLDRIRDLVQEQLSIAAAKIKSDRWSQKKKGFIRNVYKHLTENPFPVAMDRRSYNSLLTEKKELDNTIENLLADNEKLEQQVKELEKAKDPVAVKAIKKKYSPSSDYATFKLLCSEISKLLRPFRPIIKGIIFKTYNHKPPTTDWQAYRNEIEEADAEDYIDIDDDGAPSADWQTTAEMRDLKSKLNELARFLDGSASQAFYSEYEQENKAPLKIDNRTFWEELFKWPVIINEMQG